ncbi:GTP pyrophosphokinase family protein [Clostridium frigoris]|uniref:GTP pyrophosphokinase family protein n=1 Tax=Clostridium frigoris TaxID=205327 RepID=A0ABS6BWK0_9CLOT|nr:GTP pyrophosphokinase family protein [Clostridium frigoris]MBU3160407.1 GTP pyrophosphokinase family protein [Clostridium frigoris]
MDKSIKTDKVFFNQIIDKAVSPRDMEGKIEELEELIMIYSCAIKEVSTKLEILDYEFKIRGKRNPIEYMKSRVKSPRSIMDKLIRKNLEPTIKVARKKFDDIAGIRVVCSFVSDIYKIADMLKRQEDITLIEEKDYIENPKPNGYRSLHMVLEIPIFFSDHVEPIRVEVQIRTIAMDFWASLEHKLYYKKGEDTAIHIKNDLKDCADIIAATDMKMQNIEIEVDKLS